MGMDYSEDEQSKFVLDWVTWSSKPLMYYAPLWSELYQNYRVVPYGAENSLSFQHTYPFAERKRSSHMLLKDPETHQIVTVLASNMFMQTLGDDDFVRVQGGNQDDPAVRAQEHVVQWMFRRPGNLKILWKAFIDMAIYGFAWIENPIEVNHRARIGGERKESQYGTMEEMSYAPEMVSEVLPVWRNLNVFDVYPDWSKPFGPEMTGAVKVGMMPAMEFRDAMKRAGGVKEDKLGDALGRNTSEWHTSNIGEKWRQLVIDGLDEEDMKLPEAYRPVMYFQFRGEVPWKDPDDISKYRVLTVVNGITVQDAEQPYYPHPWRCLQINPFNGRSFGIGAAEALRYEQDELDTWKILKNEAGVKMIRAAYLVGDGGAAVKNPQQLTHSPSGSVIPVRDINQVKMLEHNMSPFFTALQGISTQKQLMRAAVGASNVMQGLTSGGRPTAREITETSRQGNLPLAVKVDLLESEDFPTLARDIPQRLILALQEHENPDEKLTSMVGTQMRLADLAEDLSIRFVGSLRYESKMGFSQQLQNVLQIISSIPGASNLINVPRLLLDIMRDRAPDAAERYLNTAMQAIGQQAALQGLAGGQQPQGQGSPPRNPVAAGGMEQAGATGAGTPGGDIG